MRRRPTIITDRGFKEIVVNTPRSASISARVARGAKWMDTNVPYWWKQVEVNTLDMASPCSCVLGQVFADDPDVTDGRQTDGFCAGIERLPGDVRGKAPTIWSYIGQTYSSAAWHGFDAVFGETREEEFDLLGRAWRKVIADRRAIHRDA